MSDFADNVSSLKAVIARPGLFATLFPETTDDDLVLVLLDGFSEAQLDGMLLDYTADDDGGVTPDLNRAQTALVILYAGLRLIHAELFNRATSKHYVGAGGVTFEETQSTNILRDIMKAMEADKKRIIDATSTLGMIGAFYMADQYVVRALAGSRHNYGYDYSLESVYQPSYGGW